MDHRITIAIIAVFGGTLAFTFFVVSLTTSIKPDAAVAMAAEGDEEGGAAAVSPRDELIRVVQMLDRRTEQWRRDHGGRMPDFAAYPMWEQFRQKTGREGNLNPGPSEATQRPYLSRLPVNPLNKLSSVIVVDGPLKPADRVPPESGRAAFVYSTVDRCFWGTNGSGRVILVRGSEPSPIAAPAPTTAPTTVPTTAPTTLPTTSPTTLPTIPPPPVPATLPAPTPAPVQ